MGEIKNWREFLKDVPTDILLSEIGNRKEDHKNSIKASPLAFEIMEELDDALVTFGSYTFSDKGPHEVIDVYTLKYKLKDLPIKDIGETLSQVLDNYKEVSVVGGGDYESSRLVNAIIGEFDSLSEEDFTELLDCDDRFEY